MATKWPKGLFKYLGFSARLVDQLCCGEAYFADPANFNDPLDCAPIVVPDLPTDELKLLLAHMVRERTAKELDGALRKLKLRGDNAIARRDKLSQTEANYLIGELAYNATAPDAQSLDDALGDAVENELRKSHIRGVLCLSAKYNSPLMWSHYADQHRGVCVEYDVSTLESTDLHRVTYDQPREVRASRVRDWLINGDEAAKEEVERACLLTKSRQWSYEAEWRLIGKVGLQDCRMDLKSVTFGMRSSLSVQYCVVKALNGAARPVKFWEIGIPSKRFDLTRRLIDVDELLATYPRRSAYLEFDQLPMNSIPSPDGGEP